MQLGYRTGLLQQCRGGQRSAARMPSAPWASARTAPAEGVRMHLRSHASAFATCSTVEPADGRRARRWVDASAAAVAAAPQGKPFPRAREADFAFRVLPPAGAPAAAGSPQQDGRAPPRAQRYPPCSCAGIDRVEAVDACWLALQSLAFSLSPHSLRDWFMLASSYRCLSGGS